jgi:YfiR/HmsC-like
MQIKPMKIWAVLIVVIGLAAGRTPAQPAAYSVESVKAAFLYRFLEYVDWPVEARQEGPLTIAVLADESLAEELQRTVRGRKAHGREIVARSVTSLSEGIDADVLFVSASWKKRLSGLLDEHGRDPVLVVTEGEGALERGSVINFIVVDGNVRFEVSLPAAEQRGLKLSSRLLSVALRVEKSGHRIEPPTSETGDQYWVRRARPLPHAATAQPTRNWR